MEKLLQLILSRKSSLIKFRNAQLEIFEGKIISFDKKVFTGLIKSINSEIYPFNSKSFSIGITNQISIYTNVLFSLQENYEVVRAVNVTIKQET